MAPKERNEVSHGFKVTMRAGRAMSYCAASSVCHLLLWLLHAGVQVLSQLWVMTVGEINLIHYWLTWAPRNLFSQGKYFLFFFQNSSHLISSFRRDFVILSFCLDVIIRYNMQIILYHPCRRCFMFLFSPHFILALRFRAVPWFSLSERRIWSPHF
jgi:hypothetical protein